VDVDGLEGNPVVEVCGEGDPKPHVVDPKPAKGDFDSAIADPIAKFSEVVDPVRDVPGDPAGCGWETRLTLSEPVADEGPTEGVIGSRALIDFRSDWWLDWWDEVV
jgi:hypothetical protein